MIACDFQKLVDFLHTAINEARKNDSYADGHKIIETAFQRFYLMEIWSFLSRDEYRDYTMHCIYSRSVLLFDHDLDLQVTRIKDSHGKTHAVLLSFMIPYSHILVDDYLAAVSSFVSASGNTFDYETLRKMKQKYIRFWKERIAAHNIRLNHNVAAECFQKLKCQFMQVKYVPNRLISV